MAAYFYRARTKFWRIEIFLTQIQLSRAVFPVGLGVLDEEGYLGAIAGKAVMLLEGWDRDLVVECDLLALLTRFHR